MIDINNSYSGLSESLSHHRVGFEYRQKKFLTPFCLIVFNVHILLMTQSISVVFNIISFSSFHFFNKTNFVNLISSRKALIKQGVESRQYPTMVVNLVPYNHFIETVNRLIRSAIWSLRRGQFPSFSQLFPYHKHCPSTYTGGLNSASNNRLKRLLPLKIVGNLNNSSLF